MRGPEAVACTQPPSPFLLTRCAMPSLRSEDEDDGEEDEDGMDDEDGLQDTEEDFEGDATEPEY